MDQKSEAEIVARVLKGERQAYALLVEEYKSPIYNLAYRMTGNLEDADDLTQETFIRAYQYLWRYDTRKKFFAWLYTISLNLIRNHLKKTSRHRQADLLHGGMASGFADSDEKQSILHEPPDGDEWRKEQEEELESCLQELSPELRELLILRFYQKLSFETIAGITGLSLSAIKMRVYRGLEKLRKCIGKNVTSSG